MMIDCDACAARGPACADCVVTVLLGAPPARRVDDQYPGAGRALEAIDLDGDEQAAIAVLAGSGLVPPLRLVAVSDGRGDRSGGHVHSERCARAERDAVDAQRRDDRPGDGHRTAV